MHRRGLLWGGAGAHAYATVFAFLGGSVHIWVMAWPGGEIHHIDVKLDPIISKIQNLTIRKSQNRRPTARRRLRKCQQKSLENALSTHKNCIFLKPAGARHAREGRGRFR